MVACVDVPLDSLIPELVGLGNCEALAVGPSLAHASVEFACAELASTATLEDRIEITIAFLKTVSPSFQLHELNEGVFRLAVKQIQQNYARHSNEPQRESVWRACAPILFKAAHAAQFRATTPPTSDVVQAAIVELARAVFAGSSRFPRKD